MDRASASGAEGCKFESCRNHRQKSIINYLNGIVVITNYSDFGKNIARQVHDRLNKAGFDVKELKYSFKKDFHLRSWCYINFVETQNVVLVPRLGVAEDNEAVEQLSKITFKPIETINALSLVRCGGAIHCAPSPMASIIKF